MRWSKISRVLLLSAVWFAMGCSTSVDRATTQPQTAPVETTLKSIILQDVQGFSGGQALWVADDQTEIVQIVGHSPKNHSGLWEKRYKFKLTEAQWAEVGRLVQSHHLLTLKIKNHPGVPDEPLPTIVVTTTSGATAKVQKWADDKNPDFDPVYEYLLSLCTAKGELIYEGNYDGYWRPVGFANPVD